MNQKSKIVQFIKNNPDSYEKLLKEKEIKMNREGQLASFNYSITADFSDPIVQEARGIIINLKTLEVECWPFRKFGNYQESYVDEIDWNSARVQEKIDGSICKLFFNTEKNQWQFATNSIPDANKAMVTYLDVSAPQKSFLDLIKSCDNYKDIDLNKLDKDKTYIFELVTPDNEVVVSYGDMRHLYHTGTRNNITGVETVEDIGIEKPKEYPINTFQDAIKTLEKLNKSQDDIEHEGFVVVDKNFNRIKIKTPEYVFAHFYRTGDMSYKAILSMMLSDDSGYEFLAKEMTKQKELVEKVHNDYLRALERIDKVEKASMKLFESLGKDKKAFALLIKGAPFSDIAFLSLRGYVEPQILFKNMFEKRQIELMTWEKKEKEINVLIGVPGSGKSSKALVLSIFNPDIHIVSSDAIRKEMYGTETHIGGNEVFDEFYKRACEYVRNGDSIILDATNMSLKTRGYVFSRIPEKIRKDYVVNAIVMNTPKEKCIENDKNRERVVGEEPITKMISNFCMPLESEGFDNIICSEPTTVLDLQHDLLDKMAPTEQNCKYHTETVGLHSVLVAKEAREKLENGTIIGLLHDIGKLDSLQIDEKGDTHFYKHESFGAYTLISNKINVKSSNLFNDEKWIDKDGNIDFEVMKNEIIPIVNYHTRTNDWKNNKPNPADKKYLSEDLLDKLKIFRECDLNGMIPRVEQTHTQSIGEER